MSKSFKNVYKSKKVLITGNTGFKGSWLTVWLKMLGADVYGISDKIHTKPSNYEVLNLEDQIINHFVDINDFESLYNTISEINPDFVFHLAAQAIVKDSYSDPINTFKTNVIGTLNLLEVLKKRNKECIAVIITSDKCYDNVEWLWGYKETDHLGGKDPYSASKACAELVFRTFFESYFSNTTSKVKIASARAGNVIGGGDWANHRIIPDAVKSWSNKKVLQIRSPNSTRPWQHVLEPLSGYLLLGQKLYENNSLSGESFNFGPKPETNFSVESLLLKMSEFWPDVKWQVVKSDKSIKEAGLLKLNCDKALSMLGWTPNLNFDSTIEFVANWYKEYYSNNSDMLSLTKLQIEEYIETAKNQSLIWTR